MFSNEIQTAAREGRAFSFDYDGSVGGSQSLYFLAITGDREIYFDEMSGSFEKGGIRLWLYENPITTANGTAQTPVNLNFDLTTTTMALYSTPTITNNGTKKTSKFFPDTSGLLSTNGAGTDLAGGRILKANTKYLFRIQNTTISSCSFGINFIWHNSNI